MNERVMQFRIGMFVIVAGLVLTMLVVWFGESPSLFRSQSYVTVHYSEAPGVSEGIPVRKSGIRVGEVTAIRFDDRPGQPDGVLVTLALDKKFKIRAGSIPRISRALIGDVTIDFMPGAGDGPLPTSDRRASAPLIEGAVAPDPANALASATEAFQNVKGTLESIDQAAKGIAGISKKAEKLDEFLTSFRDMGLKVGVLADDLLKMTRAAGGDLPGALTNMRVLTDKLNTTLDDKTRADFQASVGQLASSTSKLDKILSDVQPLALDLGQEPGRKPATTMGQALMRFNRMTYDLSLLTTQIGDGRGRLNMNGTLQKLVSTAELYDNFNRIALSARDVMGSAKTAMGHINRFAERIANDPGTLSRGMLQRQ
ncbi:MAG: ABC-type transport system involved in resistance to organic solvent, periplasmic component [Planctomycetota bacterium]|nr:ABC-type transport system involved in resistance to organic solvent, periplasmic component [Planctomycetota bacterium]